MKEMENGVINAAEQSEWAGKPEQAGTSEWAGKPGQTGFHLTGSLVAKITAFFLLVVSFAVGVGCAIGCCEMVDARIYVDSESEMIKNNLSGLIYRVAHTVRDCLQNEYEEYALSYLDSVNAEVAVLEKKDIWTSDSSAFIWRSYDREEAMTANGFYSEMYRDVYLQTTFFEKEPGQGESFETADDMPEYVFRVFLDPGFRLEDDLRRQYEIFSRIYQLRFAIIGVLAGSVLLFVISFLFLLCSAGHKNGREGIVPGLLTGLHFDVFTAFMFLLLCSCIWVAEEVRYGAEEAIVGGILCLVSGILLMIWLMDFAVRLKLGGWWRHTLIYLVGGGIWRVIRFLGGGALRLLKGIPLVLMTVIVYFGFCIVEFMGCIILGMEAEGAAVWAFEKIAILFVVLYLALVCRKLLTASEELAEGREDCRVDTERMFGAFREHGENLNSLAQGISKAVAERMRSEHLKTELITNVSHDLKTPLTSIINYANLICQEETENPRIAEYSGVLLRQSGRLKKLLEDLVEASKATTGNLEVHAEPCEVGVMLTQAVGEYQQRMEERGLELRDRQPEQPIRILADGRHLWRVFDNLLNNICKYAQENSRVYLSVEQKEEKVLIIFRNMSKYALNISPEELEERFVRGDRSRHMEGNGLGLSIAKSLTELQHGKLDIVIDGDLFKVTLTFNVLPE